MLVRESSNSDSNRDDDDDDGNLSCDWGKDDLQYANKLVKSTDKVDQRLIDIFMIE